MPFQNEILLKTLVSTHNLAETLSGEGLIDIRVPHKISGSAVLLTEPLFKKLFSEYKVRDFNGECDELYTDYEGVRFVCLQKF